MKKSIVILLLAFIAIGIYCAIENHRLCSSGGWQLLPRFMMTFEQRAELRRSNK